MSVMDIFNYTNEELKKYTTLDRFTPVEKIVYGGVTIILGSVILYLVSLAIKK